MRMSVRVVLSGDLDLSTATAPVELAYGLMADRQVERVVVDLVGVRFIDSSGIGGLVQLSNYARSRGADVVLSGASTRVRSVLTLAGLSAVLPFETIEPSLEECDRHQPALRPSVAQYVPGVAETGEVQDPLHPA